MSGKKFNLNIITIAALALFFLASPAVTFAARTITSVKVNGGTTVSVASGTTVTAAVVVATTKTAGSRSDDWQSTGWRIATSTGAFTCINTIPETSAGTWSASTSIKAPAAAGTYNAYFIAYSGTNCTSESNASGPSGTFTLTNAVTVTASTSTPPPPSPATSTLTINLTETGGTATSSAFLLTVKNGTTTLFNGAAANTQAFTLKVGTAYSVAEATTTNSASYKISLGSNCSGTISTSSVACAVTNTYSPATTTTSTSNLIVNPSLSLDTVTPGIPDGWNQGGWGTNTVAYNYPVAGVNGGTGANVTINSYTDGDAKWYFNNVFVTPGSNYTFTDAYNANVPSSLVAQYTGSGGTLSYIDIATLPSTNGTWATTTQTITIPAGASAITMFHLISSVGSLTTTNYSLALASGGTGSNLFPEGLVSLTFDDGWESQYDNALPILQAASMHGTFYIISDGMLNAVETIFPSSDNPFNVATTTKTAVWSGIYTDPTQHSFTFSDIYTASAPSTITVSYTVQGGGASSTILGPLPIGTNAKANFAFTLPVLAPSSPLTITQAVTGANTLTATSPLLGQPVGYMDTNHVLALQSDGEEIGDHTVNHCDLVAIQTDPNTTTSCAVLPPPSTTVQQQVDDARTALQNAGLSPVDTFAYPYGSGAGNAAIEGAIGADGLIAARSVNPGYNTKTTDKYTLLNQAVDATVTNPATVQQWIDYAAANKVWLILTFHQIELSTTTIAQNKETDATTAAMLQNIVNYLGTQRAQGKIVVDTVHNVMTQYMNK